MKHLIKFERLVFCLVKVQPINLLSFLYCTKMGKSYGLEEMKCKDMFVDEDASWLLWNPLLFSLHFFSEPKNYIQHWAFELKSTVVADGDAFSITADMKDLLLRFKKPSTNLIKLQQSLQKLLNWSQERTSSNAFLEEWCVQIPTNPNCSITNYGYRQ